MEMANLQFRPQAAIQEDHLAMSDIPGIAAISFYIFNQSEQKSLDQKQGAPRQHCFQHALSLG